MSFLGDVTALGNVTLRPHDVDVTTTPVLAGGVEGVVSRVQRVGFEVRLSVLTIDGQDVTVVLTRTHARGLGLVDGATVWLTPAIGASVVPAWSARAEAPGVRRAGRPETWVRPWIGLDGD